MVRNYKWNIDKEKCLDIAKNISIDILKEKTDHIIELNELVTLLNKRTYHLDMRNNNIKRTMTKFLKSNCKGILNFLENSDVFFVNKKDNKIFISYNNKENLFGEFDDWLYINKENIKS